MTEPLFCPLRKLWVAPLPEEKIRQALVQKMIQELGYPQESVALEKSLHQLPHLQSKAALPNRRADIIVFAKNLHLHHHFYPLLLIECKATPLTHKVLRQIIGYNQFVEAYFIAAVNQTTLQLGWYDRTTQDYRFEEGLPSYDELIYRARM